MVFWEGELKELGNIYNTFRVHLPDIVKELEQLIKTDDPNVVMLYSRRCLEVIVTDLCENELKRPRKTEPLKGIIDKLNAEEKVPPHIITSMLSLNSMANYGAHPKDFDPEQVKPVLNNLSIIIKWYLKYKDFKIVSKAGPEETEPVFSARPEAGPSKKQPAGRKSRFWPLFRIALGVLLFLYLAFAFGSRYIRNINVPSYIPPEDEEETFTDLVNNEIYSVVRIGNQLWMGENLRSEKYNDGTPIPLVKKTEDWASLETPAYCWYDNNKALYKPSPYGALYNWYAVNTGKLCPAGWHVPSAAEWDTLVWFAGDSIPADMGWLPYEKETAGIKLKETGNDHWLFNDTIHATDDFGFTALPGGNRNVYGPFLGIGERGYWWTSSEEEYDPENDDAADREMYYDSNGVIALHQYRKFGMSVRCVKDKP
jgi:uncharacterized protein (TIGR02145 family)